MRKITVTAKSFYSLGAIFLFGAIAPFLHVFFNNTGIKGIFGFPTMSSFLFAIGFPVFVIVISYLFAYGSRHLPKPLSNIYLLFSQLTGFVGFYFFTWAINPFVKNDFHWSIYYGAMIVVSITVTLTFRQIFNFVLRRTKGKTRFIMNLLAERAISEGHVKNKDLYMERIVLPALQELKNEEGYDN